MYMYASDNSKRETHSSYVVKLCCTTLDRYCTRPIFL